MKFTTSHNERVNLLSLAYRYIQDTPADEPMFICWSLGNHRSDASQELIQWISSLLAAYSPKGTWVSELGGWLRQHHGIDSYQTNYRERLKATRLAWIDWMIEQQ